MIAAVTNREILLGTSGIDAVLRDNVVRHRCVTPMAIGRKRARWTELNEAKVRLNLLLLS